MKKLLALFLILALLCSALYACVPPPPFNNGENNQGENNQGENNQGGNNQGGNNQGGNNQGGSNPPSGEPCATKEEHTDADSNGYCDTCNYDVVVTLDIYALNDLHGKIFDTDSQIGVDELTTYLRGAETRDEQHLLLSSGDMWQGSAESNITKGAFVTEWMNSLGFVSMTLGNHEYDWGEEPIKSNSDLAQFPFLAINVYERATNTRVDYCQPSVVIERGELKIGIIGAIGDCYSSISSDRVEDIYFKVGGELTALVKAESERLRTEEAVDIVIYSLHDGYGRSTSGNVASNQLSSYYDYSLSGDGYVDIVFEGHTHQRYSFYDTYGIYHLQNGGDNKNGISHAELDVNFVTDKARVKTAEIISPDTYSSLTPDPIVSELRALYADEIEEAFGPVGNNSMYRDDDDIENLTAMLYYQAGVEKWGEEYDIVLGGGFLRTRSPYNLYSGEVTYSDLMMLMPFDNQIVLCSVKGSDLLSKFFKTSNEDYHIYYETYGEQVYASIDSNATYYIIVDSYTSQYKWNNLTVVDTYDDYTYARDLLAEYIREGGLE